MSPGKVLPKRCSAVHAHVEGGWQCKSIPHRVSLHCELRAERKMADQDLSVEHKDAVHVVTLSKSPEAHLNQHIKL